MKVTAEELIRFNPEMIYACGDDRKAANAFFSETKWSAVSAVAKKQIYSFPCDLTCRAATHVGDFVAWLASSIYIEAFSERSHEVLPRKIIGTRTIPVPLDFVAKAEVCTTILHDFENKSLIIDFKTPRAVVSTLEGERTGVLAVGNHFSPPPCWSLNHAATLDQLRADLYTVIGKNAKSASFLFTGANMDNLVSKKETFKEMVVYALVTAGVRGNAMRMGVDSGDYYEPGTINIIILSNLKLSPQAMTRAIISATEAKTAALEDLDIRSTYQPLRAAATGTGTDNIIVVQGDGTVIDGTGGHCEMGELIAGAAYAGVREAIVKQNGIVAQRDIFQRLAERQLSLYEMIFRQQKKIIEKKDFLRQVEQVLLDRAYIGFVEAAMALSDVAERQAFNDISLYRDWCLETAGKIAGRKVARLIFDLSENSLPEPLSMALNAILTGVYLRPLPN